MLFLVVLRWPANRAMRLLVRLTGREGAVIRKTLLPFFCHGLLPGALGYSIAWSSQKGIFNLGSFSVILISVAAILIASTCGKRSG